MVQEYLVCLEEFFIIRYLFITPEKAVAEAFVAQCQKKERRFGDGKVYMIAVSLREDRIARSPRGPLWAVDSNLLVDR